LLDQGYFVRRGLLPYIRAPFDGHPGKSQHAPSAGEPLSELRLWADAGNRIRGSHRTDRHGGVLQWALPHCTPCREPVHRLINFDAFVKSQKCSLSVIPAKTGIQVFQLVTTALDPVFQRDDDFLRDHQILYLILASCSGVKTDPHLPQEPVIEIRLSRIYALESENPYI
jgi:hypothetical protein